MKYRNILAGLMLFGALTACTEKTAQVMEWQVQSYIDGCSDSQWH